jgi:hypothetical protein
VQVRLQADADFNHDIVRAVLRRDPTADFQSATDARLRGLDDLAVLAVAAEQGRILVTHDHKTMRHHFATFIASTTSPGVLVIRQKVAVAEAAESLLEVLGASEAEEWLNRIAYLPL